MNCSMDAGTGLADSSNVRMESWWDLPARSMACFRTTVPQFQSLCREQRNVASAIGLPRAATGSRTVSGHDQRVTKLTRQRSFDKAVAAHTAWDLSNR